MNKIKFEIYQGIIVPLKIDPKETIALFETLISDLIKLKIDFPLYPNLKINVAIKKITSLTGLKRALWKTHKRHGREETILKFYGNISFPDQEFKDIELDIAASNEFYIKHLLIPNFKKRFYDFITCIDIARVGAFHAGTGLLFVNDKFINHTKHLGLYSREILESSLKREWPVFESLNILSTWQWYLRKANPKDVDELSASSLSRAINAFTYLYNNNAGEIESLFWSMVGIEALYVKGKEGISEQVREKAQIFLGKIEKFKKCLTKMYAFRSAFVHGQKDFPSFFHIHDALESYDKYVNEYSETLHVAQSLLIGTLQKMAKNNMAELEFEYTLK